LDFRFILSSRCYCGVYDMNDKTKVYNADCLPAMKEFPDKHFELAIIDCPYGIDFANRGNGNGRLTKHKWKNHKIKHWDKSRPDEHYFSELFRVSQNQIIWGANYLVEYLPPSMGWIFWDKGQREFSLADGELAYTSFERALRVFTYTRGAQMQEPSERIHPTQKPVALYKWLLKNYAKEGDKILDTHGGSMSSVIACLDMGYKITCFELDKDYYNLAKLRIENHLSQINAFRPPYEIEFHDNSGVSVLRDQRAISNPKQNDVKNPESIHRIDGLLYGDPS
jgi:site-specific DNA-methyltransferase (adenine-specific)